MSIEQLNHLEQAQRRHILDRLGIPLWADRHSATVTLPLIGDAWRLTTDELTTPRSPLALAQADELALDKPVKMPAKLMDNTQAHLPDKTSQAVFDHSDAQIDLKLAGLINKKTVQSVAGASRLDNDTLPNTMGDAKAATSPNPYNQSLDHPTESLVQFHLQGVGYAGRVLIVNMDEIGVSAKSLWLSLVNALDKHAKAQRLTLIRREIRFPVSELSADIDRFEFARTTFFGFMFGLSKGSATSLIALTSLPDVVQARGFNQGDAAWIHDNLLDQMLIDSALKKKFWQLLTGS